VVIPVVVRLHYFCVAELSLHFKYLSIIVGIYEVLGVMQYISNV